MQNYQWTFQKQIIKFSISVFAVKNLQNYQWTFQKLIIKFFHICACREKFAKLSMNFSKNRLSNFSVFEFAVKNLRNYQWIFQKQNIKFFVFEFVEKNLQNYQWTFQKLVVNFFRFHVWHKNLRNYQNCIKKRSCISCYQGSSKKIYLFNEQFFFNNCLIFSVFLLFLVKPNGNLLVAMAF